jgi:hypothetical protein
VIPVGPVIVVITVVVVTVVVIAIVVVVTVVVDDSRLNGGRGKDGRADGRSCDKSGRHRSDAKPVCHLVSSTALRGTPATFIEVMLMDGDRPSPRGLGRCTPGSAMVD